MTLGTYSFDVTLAPNIQNVFLYSFKECICLKGKDTEYVCMCVGERGKERETPLPLAHSPCVQNKQG